MTSQQLLAIDTNDLTSVTGGAGAAASQVELRQLAQKHCPVIYAANKNVGTITRPLAEKCLDEAGYGMFKGSLDKYFPKTK